MNQCAVPTLFLMVVHAVASRISPTENQIRQDYYSSSPLAALRERERPYGVPFEKTFLGFTTFTHRGIGSVR